MRRIIHVLPWSSVGGTEVATLRIAQALTAPEYTHVALCSDPASAAARFFRSAGLPTEGYVAPYLSLRQPLDFLQRSARLARQLKALHADVIHCADVISAFHAILAAWIARTRLVCHVRNPYPRLPRRYRVLFRGVDKFVFVSQHTRDSFALRVPEKQATVIYDGIDVSALSQLEARASVLREFELPSNVRLVGMAARLSPQKDHGTLLRAFREVITEHPDAHLLIIGDVSGSSSAVKIHENLRQLAADLGIGSHVTFAGFRRDISRLLAAMDIVTLVTHFEGLPLVLLEAMAQARPIVATATGGIPELVVHQETGLLHRLQSVSELASHIRLLLQDEAQARRLGEAGRRLVEERFTMERFSANMAGLYRSLLGAPSRVDTSLRSDS